MHDAGSDLGGKFFGSRSVPFLGKEHVVEVEKGVLSSGNSIPQLLLVIHAARAKAPTVGN